MFIKSFKISGRRLAGIGVMCAVLLALAVYGVGARMERPREDKELETGAQMEKRVSKGVAKTEADRHSFIEQYGWKTGAEPEEIVEVVIPEEFDEVFTRYNELQKQQGYDLEKFHGKRCKRYTYLITNYPGVKDTVRANLLVCDGKVIGGDVSSISSGGFMHGFALNSAAIAPAELNIPTEEHSTEAMLESSPEAQETVEPSEAPIEETMASELEAMEKALLEALPSRAAPTEDVMPTD